MEAFFVSTAIVALAEMGDKTQLLALVLAAVALSAEAKAASAGLASLTPQQFRVLTMVCEGLLNKQIAWELSVSEATIKAHVTAIFRKLGVQNRTQAVLAISALNIEDKKM